MHSTDFIPRIIQKEVAFSTLSLIGDIPGPKYELFKLVLTFIYTLATSRISTLYSRLIVYVMYYIIG